MKRTICSALLALVAAGVCAAPACAAAASPAEPPPPASEGVEFFEKNIRPLLVEHCYKCHSVGAEKGVKGELLLDSRGGVMKGGEGGPILVSGSPEASRLVRALQWKDDKLQMPPKKALAPEKVVLFEQWVKMGAPDPRDKAPTPTAGPAPGAVNLEEGKKFWSFQPVQDPPVPAMHNANWPASAVDRFLLAKLEEKGLAPAPPADKRALIRRATYDLTGLPPAPQEVEAFVADTSSNAFEKVVDRLLASPAYGERWGRHWLDLVRYADTSGCNSDFPVPALAKYRNYVIDSFNKDKPYDQFVREQIAGDLLPAKDAAEEKERLIATGYLPLSRRFGSRNNENHLTMEDSIDNIGKVMLGLSVSCARCHDHKFDPIPSEDYYALYGILSSTRYSFPGTEIYRHTKDFVPVGTPEEVKEFYDYQAELAALDDKVEELTVERAQVTAKMAAVDAAATDGGFNAVRTTGFALQMVGGGVAPAATALQLAATVAQQQYPPGARTLDQVRAEQLEAKNRQQQLEYKPPTVEKIFAAIEGTPADARIQFKGDPKTSGPACPRSRRR